MFKRPFMVCYLDGHRMIQDLDKTFEPPRGKTNNVVSDQV